MGRPSEPLLAWLRDTLKQKGLNTAHIADASGLSRTRVRKILGGVEDMTVDELMMLSDGLQLDPSDLTGVALAETEALASLAEGPVPLATANPDVDDRPDLETVIDPWGNQPEQLFRIAFGLGCDFLFLATASELAGSGVPGHVVETYKGRELPIKLEAAYHKYNEPKYSPEGISLTLSFDALYDCHFKWSCIKQFVLYPAEPQMPEQDDDAAPDTPGPAVPHLRLVT